MTDTHDAPGGPAASGRAQPTEMPELPGVTHAFVRLSTGLRMHVAEAGNPDAPPVLLLHGFPQHWWEWRKVIPPLADRYRVVAPDLRGAGWTDASADGYTVGNALADVLALLDALGLRRVGLVAHDFSVFVGFRLCFDHPEGVAAFLCLGRTLLAFQAADAGRYPAAVVPAGRRHAGAGAVGLVAESTTTPDSITDEDLAVFTGRLHAQGIVRPARRWQGNLILPEMGRFLASAYR